MQISKSVLDEVMGKLTTTGVASRYVQETFNQIQKEKPALGRFINGTLRFWEERMPNLEDQLRFYLAALLTIANVMEKGKEGDEKGIEEEFRKIAGSSSREILLLVKDIEGKNFNLAAFIAGTQETWRKKSPLRLNHQLQIVFAYMVALTDLFRRQKEVEKVEELINK